MSETPSQVVKADVSAIADTFVDQLTAYVGAANMILIAQRNVAEPHPLVCHTHDFADANVFMDAAFKAHGVKESGQHGLLMVDRTDDWNAAWAIARERIVTRFLPPETDLEDQDDQPGMKP